MTPLSVAVIGAGIAGLGAARELQRVGCRVTVFEAQAVPGGRIASHRFNDLVFDSGAQNIKAEGTALEAIAREVLSPDDFAPIAAPVYIHENGRIFPGDERANTTPKWSCRGGMVRLCEAFAADLDVRYSMLIGSIEEGDKFTLTAGTGEIPECFDRAVLALPAPQSAALLRASLTSDSSELAAQRIASLEAVEYSRCLTGLLHYPAPLSADWYALLARDRSHPLLWLARENAKGASFVGEGTSLIAQLGSKASEEMWKQSDEQVILQTCGWIEELLGKAFAAPQWHFIQRWRHAQPLTPAAFDEINPPHSRLVVCGDGVSAPRVPDAYESGVRTAGMLLS